MVVEVRLPQLGDSVTKAVVTSWLKAEGDRVEKDEPLLEVTTDKVTVEVPADVSGVLKEIVAKAGDHVRMDDVLCRIEQA